MLVAARQDPPRELGRLDQHLAKKKLDRSRHERDRDYVWSTPCAITYRFKGNKLAKTEHEPAGCKP